MAIVNIKLCVSQTQKNFIMFIILLGQHVSILIESSSGPFKKIDPYLECLKMRCGIPNACILDQITYKWLLYIVVDLLMDFYSHHEAEQVVFSAAIINHAIFEIARALLMKIVFDGTWWLRFLGELVPDVSKDLGAFMFSFKRVIFRNIRTHLLSDETLKSHSNKLIFVGQYIDQNEFCSTTCGVGF